MAEDKPMVPASQYVEEQQEEGKDANASVHERELTWKCGQAYQYVIPQPDGDPWEEILAFVMAEDRKRCKSLTDDIQLSLVVASLFSAVVVSLMIFYYPRTVADPQDEMINLLTRLVTITEDPANTTLATVPLESWDKISNDFEPSFKLLGAVLEYLVCVWFSMAAVIMGISALQWLKAYETYPKATPKQKFALLSMRKVSFSTWRVPLLIKFLPVLLLSSLYIFTVAFSGFQVWILPINALQLLFGYMLTFGIFLLTVLPALEEYMLHFPRINPFLRGRIQAAPCPYRSIQANIWRLIVCYSKTTLYIFLPWACTLLFPLYVVVTTFKGSWSSPVKLVFTAPKLDSPYRHSNWSELNWEWLMIRWTHFTELYDTYLQAELRPRDVTGLHFDERLLYDAIEGLIYVAEGQVTNPHVLYAAYYCFADLSRSSLGLRSRPQLADTVASQETIRNNRYIQALLANPTNRLPFHASSLSSAIADPTLRVLHEENMLLFLQAIFTRGAGRMTSEQSPNPIWPPAFSSTHLSIISQHLTELHVRVKGHFYNDRLLTSSSPFFEENHNLLPRHVDWSVVYFYQYVEDAEAKKAFTQNYLAMLSNILEECGREWQLELRMGALLTHSNLYHLILNGARATHYAAHDQDGYISIEQLHGTVFAALRHGLILFLSQPSRADTTEAGAGSLVNAPGDNINNRPRPDLLFYAACIYVQYLAEREAGDSPLMDALDDIIPILRSYRAQCPPNALLERSLGVTFTPQWWSFLATPAAEKSTGAPNAKQTTTTMGRLLSRGLSAKRTTPDGRVTRGRLTKKYTGESFGVGAIPGPSSATRQSGAGMSSSVQLDEKQHGAAHTVNRKVVADDSEDSDEDEDDDDEQGHVYPPGTQSVVDDVHGAGVRLLGPQAKAMDNSSRYNLV
ncbi:hypothetical protein D9619_010931 [Psilocybe cf. subviscida]|uniref:DUF6535 domain-containing protein n=1 Tax=Psilocybe cf. subviscida TaxID=2480587 RepID=A0A8H5B8C5_9AGAR|nr:hypothetical protein D9619_010931 [Psilocybe cf. subviscida]